MAIAVVTRPYLQRCASDRGWCQWRMLLLRDPQAWSWLQEKIQLREDTGIYAHPWQVFSKYRVFSIWLWVDTWSFYTAGKYWITSSVSSAPHVTQWLLRDLVSVSSGSYFLLGEEKYITISLLFIELFWHPDVIELHLK